MTSLGRLPWQRWVPAFAEHPSRVPVYTVVGGVLAVGMGLLHMAQREWFLIPTDQFRSLHLNLALLLAVVMLVERLPERASPFRVALVHLPLLAIIPLVYIHLEYDALVHDRVFYLEPADLWVACLLLLITQLAAYLLFGWANPIIAFLAMLYAYFGYLLSGDLLYHHGLKLDRLLGYTSIPYFRGLLGDLTEISAAVTFMYLLYAGLLTSTGGIDYVMKLAFTLSGRGRAAPAQAAIVGSGFHGMISGSAIANVGTIGTVTIPLMIRFGFKPRFAGAVEAVASIGGQFTPPKMGATAFLIVGITGIPYTELMAAAIVPALVYYIYLMIAVQVRAVKEDIHAGRMAEQLPENIPMRDVSLARATLLHLPVILSMAVLVTHLLTGFAAGAAALYACVWLIGLELAKRLLLSRGDILAGLAVALRNVSRGLVEGSRGGAQVGIIIAAISILVEMMVATGFAQKLSILMLDIAGHSLPLLMALSALICIVLGTGLPTSASYVVVALLGAPALAELGVPVLAAHLYVFYFAVISDLTPPVAFASMLAAQVAKADFTQTSMTALRLGLPGFLAPLLFVVHPEILGLQGTLLDQLVAGLGLLFATIALNLAMEGFILRPLGWIERLLLVPAALGLLYPGWQVAAAGMLLFAGVLGYQWLTQPRVAARVPS